MFSEEEEGFEEVVREVEEKEVVEIKVELLKQMLEVSKMWRRVLSGEASIEELAEAASSRADLKPAPRARRGKGGRSPRRSRKTGAKAGSRKAKRKAKAKRTGK